MSTSPGLRPLKSPVPVKSQTFSNIPTRIFFKPKTQFVSIPKGSEPEISLELIKKGKVTKNKRFFEFYSDRCIYYQSKECLKVKGIAIYDFDLKLEWLFKSPKEFFQSGEEEPYGFKLIRGNNINEIYFVNLCDYPLVSTFLKKKINTINFHFWYKAIKRIGKGNFATVYLVENRENGFQYAVKAFLKETIFAQKKGKESIKNEIHIMRTLDHINVIELKEVFETDNSLYLIMELLKGGNMISYLNPSKKIPENEIRIFMTALLKAVSHMHEKGIMHRDIKPENILMRNESIKECNICLADFGLSTFVNVDRFLFTRCGTPGFVAPEIFNWNHSNQKYSEVCDEFSVGVIFHILLFGHSVFHGKSYDSIVKENKACEFNFKSNYYNKISKEEKDLLMKLLQVNPDKRIKAKDALCHDYFNINMRTSVDETENDDDKHTLENNLKMYNARKFEVKGIKDLNENFSFFGIDYSQLENHNFNLASSSQLIITKPCWNGFVKTYENINSNRQTQEDLHFRTNNVLGSPLASPGIRKFTLNSFSNPQSKNNTFCGRSSPQKISNFLEYGKVINKISVDLQASQEEIKKECSTSPSYFLKHNQKKKIIQENLNSQDCSHIEMSKH